MLKSIKIIAASMLAAFLFGGCIKDIKPKEDVGCADSFDEAALPGGGWTKVFEEQFDTDLSKWDIALGGGQNNEKQLYQASNLVLENGVLRITSKKEAVTYNTKLFQFTSGRLETKTQYCANPTKPNLCAVARIQVPIGNGMWPAFWMTSSPWPTNGEIDIMESHGLHPNLYTTNYYYGVVQDKPTEIDSKGLNVPYGLTSCFHTYHVIWTENKLSYYLDGSLVNVKTSKGIPMFFNKMQHVILNLAVGGDYTGNPKDADIHTNDMLIDYVKVYTK